MTATPTPLRELLTEARREFRDSDAAGDVLDWLEERATLAGASFDVELVADMLRRYSAIVTSDGFDAAGHYTDACIGEQIDALESSEAGAETVALATPPASGEADPQNWPQWVKDAVRNANEAGRHAGRAEATPSAASGDGRSPSYDALLIIVQSVCGALKRAGFDDCDDPGEAIDVMREGYERRLAAVAPAGMGPITAWVGEMKTSAGVDFYVCVGRRSDRMIDRSVTYLTPNKYRIRGRAEYDVACWNAMLTGGEQPDILAFDTDGPTPPATAGKE